MRKTSMQDERFKIIEDLGGNGMFKHPKKRIKNEKGLTLIELLAVIVILGIIAAIAVPAIGNIINDSRDKAIVSEALNVIAGAKLAHLNGDCGDASSTPDVCEATELAGYVEGVNLGDVTVTRTDGVWVIANTGTIGEPKNEKFKIEGQNEETLAGLVD